MVTSFFPDQKFEAYLFDFDGTIADTMHPHFEAWNKSLRQYGVELSRQQHLDWAGRPTREIVKLLSDLYQVDLSIDDISKSKETHYLGSLAGVKEIVPVMQIIRESYGKIPMAIVSGSRRKIIQATLQHLKLEKYFQVLICAEDYVHGKPAPDCFLKAAAALNVNPAHCLAFEDATLGLQAALAAGMACLRVSENPEAGHALSLHR